MMIVMMKNDKNDSDVDDDKDDVDNDDKDDDEDDNQLHAYCNELYDPRDPSTETLSN